MSLVSRNALLLLAFAAAGPSVARAGGSFSEDLTFLEKHTDIVLLKQGDAAVAVAPAYQGRVMTSAINAGSGAGFGWINRPVITAGILDEKARKGKLEEHIYIFGGEERFWLGPEGGQFALFFKPGSKFEFADWSTPAVLDTEPFEMVKRTVASVEFHHECELVNFSGTRFKVGIDRGIRMLGESDATKLIGSKPDAGIRMVGYETDNRITNLGNEAWNPDTGLLSIWMLGMYNPSPATTVVIPFKAGDEAALGPKVNDAYFGKVPPEYLKIEDDVLFFRGDGTRRGKIGINSKRSKGIAGSFDSVGNVLNIVTYNLQDAPAGFVNSMWEMQREPYAGDVLNAYNDGSPAPGAPPLGPFYELETSSPAAALKPGGTMRHLQRTYHFQGTPDLLDPIAKHLLGVGIETIQTRFNEK